MSVPVDVLYVLDRVCALPFASHGIAELDDTRAAVAELIEKAEQVNAMSIQTEAHMRLRLALRRVRPLP